MLSQLKKLSLQTVLIIVTLNLVSCGGGDKSSTESRNDSDITAGTEFPKKIVVTVTEPSAGVFLIKWDAPKTSGVTLSFKIDRTNDNSQTFTPINLNFPNDDVRELTDSSIIKGKAYLYRIIAVTAEGESEAIYSEYVTAGVIKVIAKSVIKVTPMSAGTNFVALAFSPNGTTFALGLSAADIGEVTIDSENRGGQGVVEMYTKSSVDWKLDTVLTALAPEAENFFGTSVSFDNTGTVVAVGSSTKPLELITKTGLFWANNPNSEVLGTNFFFSNYASNSAFSPDGKTFAISGGLIFTKSDLGQWQDSQNLFVSGIGLAFSPDGSTLAIGNNYKRLTNGKNVKVVKLYKKVNTEWRADSDLESEMSIEREIFGSDLIFSGDGNTLVVLSNSYFVTKQKAIDNSRVILFSRSGAQWQRTNVIYGISGKSVSINFDGRLLLVGNRVYKKVGLEWKMTHRLLRKNDQREFATKSVLSFDGNTAIVYFRYLPDSIGIFDSSLF